MTVYKPHAALFFRVGPEIKSIQDIKTSILSNEVEKRVYCKDSKENHRFLNLLVRFYTYVCVHGGHEVSFRSLFKKFAKQISEYTLKEMEIHVILTAKQGCLYTEATPGGEVS